MRGRQLGCRSLLCIDEIQNAETQLLARVSGGTALHSVLNQDTELFVAKTLDEFVARVGEDVSGEGEQML
jgi:hypothetical protein